MIRLRPRFIIFLVGILMMVSGISLAWSVQNNFGTVQASEITLITAEGVPIAGILQVPLAASSSSPLPGVVVIHGALACKEWIMGYGHELARRGFVVLAIDVVGHGNSGPSAGSGTDYGGLAALEFLDSLPYVSTLGMIGHSMGAGIIFSAINASSIQVDGIVIIAGARTYLETWANASYPCNILVAVGLYDELFNIPQLLTLLAPPFNTSAPVIPNYVYGSHPYGTARKVIIPPTNHLFEAIDPTIISESAEWLMYSLKGSPDIYWLPKRFLIYPAWIIGGFIACLGAVLSVLAQFTILINLRFFQSIQRSPSSSYAASTPMYIGFGVLYGLIGLGLLLVFIMVDLPFSLPQSMGVSIGLGLLGGGLVALLVLFGIRYVQQKKADSPSWNDYGGFNGKSKTKDTTLLKTIGLGFLLGFIGIAWLYLWVLPVDLILALDFRAFLPFLKALSPSRVVYLPLYFLLLMPFFLVEGLWLMGFLRTAPKDTWVKTQTWWTSKAIFMKCLLYALIIFVQIFASFALGRAFISGNIGYQLIFLYMFIPMFAVSTTVIAWAYRLSERFYIAVVFNALLFAWLMAAILPIYF